MKIFLRSSGGVLWHFESSQGSRICIPEDQNLGGGRYDVFLTVSQFFFDLHTYGTFYRLMKLRRIFVKILMFSENMVMCLMCAANKIFLSQSTLRYVLFLVLLGFALII